MTLCQNTGEIQIYLVLTKEYHCVRTAIIALALCFCCFLLPIQVYLIGGNTGFGIETALFRYQVTGQGNSLIPLTTDLSYVTGGIYTGRTALSVGFWISGTLLLICTTIFSLIYAWQMTQKQIRIIKYALAGAGILFLVSCLFQYGLLLNGAAGVSMPIGILVLILVLYVLHSFEHWFEYDDTCPVSN
jgi:hypothetical protein